MFPHTLNTFGYKWRETSPFQNLTQNLTPQNSNTKPNTGGSSNTKSNTKPLFLSMETSYSGRGKMFPLTILYKYSMGKLEKESYKRNRGVNLQRAVLKSVAMAGVVSVAVVAPNALRVLKLLGVDKMLNRNTRQGINVSRRRLIENGFLSYPKDGFIRLTKKGEQKLYELEKHDYKLPHPKKWDKKWRVLIFDIPEKKRLLRDKVRVTLSSIGFKHLQDSVWVYPHDCEDLITLIKADFKIGKDLLYLIVDSIENDRSLREWFGID